MATHYLTFGYTPSATSGLPSWHQTVELDATVTWDDLKELAEWFEGAVKQWQRHPNFGRLVGGRVPELRDSIGE